MNSELTPEAWTCPHWHSDYCSRVQEFEQLQAFAIELRARAPGTISTFLVPEEGLMLVRIQLASGVVAEVYSVEKIDKTETRQLAIFLCPDTKEESEFYADSIGSAVGRILMVDF